MGAAVEADLDLLLLDRHVGRHVDEVAEDLAGLGVGVAAHASGEEAVEAAGDDQEGHVEVDLEADGGGERVHVEEAHGVGERVLDEHALGVAGDELRGRGASVVGQQDRRLVVAEVLDEELAEGAVRRRLDRLLVDARGPVLAGAARRVRRCARRSAAERRSP